jgi:hypothetical protein
MGRVVYRHSEVLFPRLDETFNETASEMFGEFAQGYPNPKKNLLFTMDLVIPPHAKTADLTITVTKPPLIDWGRWFIIFLIAHFVWSTYNDILDLIVTTP